MTAESRAIAAETAEDLAARAIRLEREVQAAQRNGERVARDLHAALLDDLEAAEKRARKAERRAERAQEEARQARREVARMRASATWRAGRAVVAVPAAISRRTKSTRRTR